MKKYTDSGSKDTRSGFGAGLEELGKTNENVVALCADLTGSLKMNAFADQNPDRFYQVGIAEANMMGIAAGLLLLIAAYFLLPFSAGESNPIAATSTELIELHISGSRGETPTPQTTRLDNAIKLFEQKNYQAALPILDRIILEDTENRATAQVLKADALYRQDKKTDALQTLKSIGKADETFYEKIQAIIEKME